MTLMLGNWFIGPSRIPSTDEEHRRGKGGDYREYQN